MGVYIDGLDMPKSCKRCPFTCEALQFFNGKDRPQRCPLIEIDDEIWENEKYKLIRMTEEQRVNKKLAEVVRCGECKYMRKYALRSDEPTGIWCHRWSVPRLVTDDDFCSYGERRADVSESNV